MNFVVRLFEKNARARWAAAVQRTGLVAAQPAELHITNFQANHLRDQRDRFYEVGRTSQSRGGDQLLPGHHLNMGLNEVKKADLMEYRRSLARSAARGDLSLLRKRFTIEKQDHRKLKKQHE